MHFLLNAALALAAPDRAPPAQSLWVSGVAHGGAVLGAICDAEPGGAREPLKLAAGCDGGVISYGLYGGGVEIGGLLRRTTSDWAFDLRVEMGGPLDYVDSSILLFAPSAGARLWDDRRRFYTSVRAKFLWIVPGLAASAGVALGERHALSAELGAELLGVAFLRGPGLFLNLGWAYGDR